MVKATKTTKTTTKSQVSSLGRFKSSRGVVSTPKPPKKRLRYRLLQPQTSPNPRAHGDRLRPPQAGRPGHRGPHRQQPVQQLPGEPALGESERADPALVRHERGPRVERPEAVEAGGGT